MAIQQIAQKEVWMDFVETMTLYTVMDVYHSKLKVFEGDASWWRLELLVAGFGDAQIFNQKLAVRDAMWRIMGLNTVQTNIPAEPQEEISIPLTERCQLPQTFQCLQMFFITVEPTGKLEVLLLRGSMGYRQTKVLLAQSEGELSVFVDMS